MKVQLINPHTHAGVGYQPDDVIEVNEHEAKWLAEHGIVHQGNKKTRWLRSVPSDTPSDEESQA